MEHSSLLTRKAWARFVDGVVVGKKLPSLQRRGGPVGPGWFSLLVADADR
jgi:hypothetical protein